MSGTVAIFLPNLASGGAERVNITLAVELIKSGWQVTFVLQQQTGALLTELPKGAETFALQAKSTLAALIPLSRYIKANTPDILLSSLGHNNIVAIWALMLAKSKTRLVACQHSILSHECARGSAWRYRLLPFLSRLFLPKADAIVAISQGGADDLAQTVRIKRERIEVIKNPVITPGFVRDSKAAIDHPWLTQKTMPVLLAVGRLAPVKDFRTLIDAFAISNKTRSCRLLIIGEGEQRDELMRHAASRTVSDYIEFTGFIANVLPYMRRADALIVSSRYEGFGNVLVEAMACGTPVISTDCPHGPAEIFENGRFGTLVPVGDAEAMAGAILTTLAFPPDTTQAQEHALQFTASQSARKYGDLFHALKKA